jgi:hypothetical protein
MVRGWKGVTMSEQSYRRTLFLLVCVVLVAIGSVYKTTAQIQPLSDEWTKDFTRRVIEACDLPVGDPGRPSRTVCNLPGR